MKIKLGVIAKDKVTGIVGVVDNRATYVHGCDRYCLQPKGKEDGSYVESVMVDEPQIEVLDLPAVMEPMPEPKQTIPLGAKVNDPIRNMSGTAMGRAVYLNGCSRIWVQTKQQEKGKESINFWAEEPQLVLKKKLFKKTPEIIPENKTKTGGPAPSNSSRY